jgi:hypothetical protein
MIKVKYEFNGKPFDSKSFRDALMKAAMEAVAAQVREIIGSVRHPDTGEFPTVVVSATSLEDMTYRVEGSPELLALVSERLQLTDKSGEPEHAAPVEVARPKVFLSYGWEDRELASRIAQGLQANGIDTWWAEWCLSAGDSLRQKIDEGLGECTHFVVLLTPASIAKPWVNQEMDAGLVRKLRAKAKFIPLRYGLAPDALPPLLSGMLSPAVEDPETDIGQLINDIFEVTKKPPLGKPPVAAQVRATGYSAAATAIAKAFVEGSQVGCGFDPAFSFDELTGITGLSRDDITDAVHELRGMAKSRMGDHITPEEELFATFDSFWKPWKPADDALRLAADLLNDADFPRGPEQIAERYQWEPRRLNPAIAYLASRSAIQVLRSLGSHPWVVHQVVPTDATRRFVKSRS